MGERLRRFAPWTLLAITLALVGVWVSAPAWAQDDEAAPKCNCYYPATGEYGVIKGGNCRVVNCWIPTLLD